jgi:uncharacterized protein
MSAIHVSRRDLDDGATEALLAKHHVGFMALAFHDRVSIGLVNYVYANRWIYGRFEGGPDLATLQHHRWVAFEVSEIDSVYDWRTVIVHGSVDLLSPTESPQDEYRVALERLRSAVPAILTAHDPMPQRVQLFRLHVDELVGRASRSDASAGLPLP